jgi:hypothetical protein
MKNRRLVCRATALFFCILSLIGSTVWFATNPANRTILSHLYRINRTTQDVLARMKGERKFYKANRKKFIKARLGCPGFPPLPFSYGPTSHTVRKFVGDLRSSTRSDPHRRIDWDSLDLGREIHSAIESVNSVDSYVNQLEWPVPIAPCESGCAQSSWLPEQVRPSAKAKQYLNRNFPLIDKFFEAVICSGRQPLNFASGSPVDHSHAGPRVASHSCCEKNELVLRCGNLTLRIINPESHGRATIASKDDFVLGVGYGYERAMNQLGPCFVIKNTKKKHDPTYIRSESTETTWGIHSFEDGVHVLKGAYIFISWDQTTWYSLIERNGAPLGAKKLGRTDR